MSERCLNVLNLRLDQPRWEMTYADGTVRRSMYRWDLIREDEMTVLGFEAAREWPVYERPNYITEVEGPTRD